MEVKEGRRWWTPNKPAKSRRIAAVLGVATIVLAGCGSRPGPFKSEDILSQDPAGYALTPNMPPVGCFGKEATSIREPANALYALDGGPVEEILNEVMPNASDVPDGFIGTIEYGDTVGKVSVNFNFAYGDLKSLKITNNINDIESPEESLQVFKDTLFSSNCDDVAGKWKVAFSRDGDYLRPGQSKIQFDEGDLNRLVNEAISVVEAQKFVEQTYQK